ncbi:MAG: rhomboid family intramembrane serine protease [Janthinobacterium lividum]|jgi:rhomboid protease GluP
MDISTPEAAAAHFAQRPDAELFYMARHARDYPAAVGAAAVAELQRRGLVPDAPSPTPLPARQEAPRETWGQLLGQLAKGMFWPSPPYVAVPLLIDLTVLVWVAMTLSGISPTNPTGHELAAWGSNVSTLTLHGQSWRLLTSLFVHGGVSHLLLNMFSLWLLGLMLEQRVGAIRLLAVYLASGLAASLATVWYHTGGINSTGASGAIFGLYGFMLVLLLSKKMVLDKSDRRAMLGLVLYLVLSNLISGISGNIDNIAHVGGLAMGLLVAGPLAVWGMKHEA